MRNGKTKKLVGFALALAFLLAAFAGCAGKGREDKEVQVETTVKDSLVVAMESDVPTLHPFDHTSVTAGYMNALTYNALFRTDPDTLEPVPDLCTEWSQQDESTWLFTIHDGVKFHDGSLMTAQDVVASMEYAREYPTTKQYSSFWVSAEALNELTIKVVTDGPYALTLTDMASLKVVPKALIDSGNDFNLNPIGTGPYRFVSQVLGDRLEFEAFEDYFDTEHAPSIGRLTWRIIPEGSSRTIALETGEVDFIVEVDSNDLQRLRDSENIEVQTVSGTRMNYFSMNNEVSPFDNEYFRKAVNAAIDREAVLTVALNGEGMPAEGVCPSIFSGTSADNSEGYDLQKAEAYLESSGVDPETVSFACIVSNDTTRRAAEVIQANLAEIGLNMTIESLDYAAWLSDVMGGTYETAITGYTSTSLARYLSGTFHTSALNAANQARVSDSYVDGIIDAALKLTDSEASDALYREVTAYLNGLTPYVPLYESIVTRAYNSELEGVKVGSSGNVRFEDISWGDQN